MQEESIPNYFLQAVVKNASGSGLDVNKLLSRAHISKALFSERQARVSAKQYAQLQAITMREMNDEMLGYSQRSLHIGSWSAVCHWMIHAKTLSQALKRFCLFYSLMERGVKTELLAKSNRVTLQFSPWLEGESIEPYGYELFMFGLHRLSCWLTESNLPIRQVKLNYPQPIHSHVYQALYPGAECIYEYPVCALVFDRRVMEVPIKQNFESLSRFLKQPLLNILVNDYNVQSWTAKTRSALRERLAMSPTIQDVSSAVGLHSKKLRRFLESEGVSYIELKNQQ